MVTPSLTMVIYIDHGVTPSLTMVVYIDHGYTFTDHGYLHWPWLNLNWPWLSTLTMGLHRVTDHGYLHWPWGYTASLTMVKSLLTCTFTYMNPQNNKDRKSHVQLKELNAKKKQQSIRKNNMFYSIMMKFWQRDYKLIKKVKDKSFINKIQ